MSVSTRLYTDPHFLAHPVPEGHPERPQRYAAVLDALRECEGLDRAEAIATPATADQVRLCHDTNYGDRLFALEDVDELHALDPDTHVGPSSVAAARRAAGSAIHGVDAVMAGEVANAFVAARPPGHHAEPARAMGFCLFNTAAIAAYHARKAHGLTRIAVADFDVHHGNGTESAFWDDANALFVSSHEYPQYPGTGRASDRGAFDNIRNAPLQTGTGSAGFRTAWSETLLPTLEAFAPDFLVISAGFDAHRSDPLGGLMLEEDDFRWITAELTGLAARICQGRIVSVLEGGYDLSALGRSARAHVEALIAASRESARVS